MDSSRFESSPQEFWVDEKEIRFTDTLSFLWKWKYLFLLITALCTGAGALVSSQMIEVYRISTVIEPGIVKTDQYGRKVRTCTGKEIKNLIDTGTLDRFILKTLAVRGQYDLPKNLEFKVGHSRDSDIVEVSYETTIPEVGLQVLENLNKALLDNFEGLVNRWKQQYGIEMGPKRTKLSELSQRIARVKSRMDTAEVDTANKIAQIKNKIKATETRIFKLPLEKEADIAKMNNEIAVSNAKIAAKKKQIKNLEDRTLDVKKEIKRIGDDTDRLIEERDRLLSSSSKDMNSFASVMYVTTVQQSISYLDNLRSSINNMNQEIFQEYLDIDQLENTIKDINWAKKRTEESAMYNIKDLKSEIGFFQDEVARLQKNYQYEIENLQSEIKALEIEKDYVNEEIKNLEYLREAVENIQVRRPPTVSAGPIRPKKMLYTFVSFVSGIFLSIFIAFLLESIAKLKDRGNPKMEQKHQGSVL